MASAEGITSALRALIEAVGVVLFVFAVYAAFAALLENVEGRTVLPMGRRQKGRAAAEGGLTEQVIDVTHEPGVRAQL